MMTAVEHYGGNLEELRKFGADLIVLTQKCMFVDIWSTANSAVINNRNVDQHLTITKSYWNESFSLVTNKVLEVDKYLCDHALTYIKADVQDYAKDHRSDSQNTFNSGLVSMLERKYFDYSLYYILLKTMKMFMA